MEQPSYQLDIDETLGFTHDTLRDIVSYWDAKRGNRAMPARADMDPLEMGQHLGWIILTDVLGTPPRFRYRLVGTEITHRIGRDSTGAFLDELYPADRYETITTPFRWVARHGRPLRAVGRLWFAQRDWLSFETAELPLARDGSNIDMILTRAVIQ